MPKLLTELALNNVKYVSMADYMRRVDELEFFEDKMAFTTRYLLAYGMEQERDVSLAEAIHIAKMKIADASAKLRAQTIMVPDEAVDPGLSDELDAPNRQFMIEPLTYLMNQANDLLMKEANGNPSEESQKRIENYQVMSAVLNNDVNEHLSNEVSALDFDRTSRDVNNRLMAKFGGVKELEKAYEATKPGLLSKAFGTSSVAYHNLDEAYNAFNNPDHALYGNMNSLDKAATEYLRHCFPKWNPRNGMIGKSAIERLSGTQKARAMFSLNILKATAEQRQSEGVYDTIIYANFQKKADMEGQVDDEVLANQENANEQFQQAVQEDLANEEPGVMSQAEKDYHANFEQEPELKNDNDDPVIE